MLACCVKALLSVCSSLCHSLMTSSTVRVPIRPLISFAGVGATVDGVEATASVVVAAPVVPGMAKLADVPPKDNAVVVVAEGVEAPTAAAGFVPPAVAALEAKRNEPLLDADADAPPAGADMKLNVPPVLAAADAVPEAVAAVPAAGADMNVNVPPELEAPLLAAAAPKVALAVVVVAVLPLAEAEAPPPKLNPPALLDAAVDAPKAGPPRDKEGFVVPGADMNENPA